MQITPGLRRVLVFTVVFFAVSIPLATFTIALVFRGLVSFMRISGWLTSYEGLVVLIASMMCLIYCILFTKWLTQFYLLKKHQSDKNFTTTVLVLLLLLSATFWFTPRDVVQNTIIHSQNRNFTGGPYPNAKTLIELKNEGYTGVISLLDPLILPEEPWLIVQEYFNAKKIGIDLIRIPMIPGNLSHLEAIKKIKALANSVDGTKRYYVHSYYDKDRVEVFIEIVNANTES